MSKRKGKETALTVPPAANGKSRRMTKKEIDAMPKPERALAITYQKDGDPMRTLSEVYFDPVTKAAIIGDQILKPPEGGLDLMGSIRALRASVAEVQAGNMGQADAMLVAEATTLDNLFMLLISKSLANSNAGYFNAAEGWMRLALKAQSQARSTWESLSKIKNPVGATFIRQANMANGPQQVNNGAEPARLPDAVATVLDGITGRVPAHGQIESQPNEILGGAYREVDPRAEATAVGGDTPVGAVAESDGTENGGG